MARALAVMGVVALLTSACSTGSDSDTAVSSTSTTSAEVETTTTDPSPTTVAFDGPAECRPVADLRAVALGTDAPMQEDLDRAIEAYVALGLDASDAQVASLDETVMLIEEVGPGATNPEMARAVLAISVGAIDRTSRPLLAADQIPEGCERDGVFDGPMMRSRAAEAGFDVGVDADWGPGQEAAVLGLARDFADGLGCPVLTSATGEHESSDWNVDIGVFRWAWQCAVIDDGSPSVAVIGVADPAALLTAGTRAAVIDDGPARIVLLDGVGFDGSSPRTAFMVEGDGSAAVTYDPERGRGLAIVSLDGSDPARVLQDVIAAWS